MKRKLSIHFHRAITDPKLEKLEVAVTPLASANRPENDQTILGLKQTREITLREPVTTVVFELTPSHQVGLDNPILYRIAWRRGSFGRIESYEFSMPDRSVDFDDLFNLGNIIEGHAYLLREDMGEPGGVAKLNELGQVIDANGNIVISVNVEAFESRLSTEVHEREEGDKAIRRDLNAKIATDIGASERRSEEALGSAVSNLQGLVTAEAETRSDEDDAIRTSIGAVQSSIKTSADKVRDEFAAADAELDSRKADLVDGKLRQSQLPDIALGTAVIVENRAEMLALTTDQVQPGDLAVRPDGTFMLILPQPWNIDSWRRITREQAVSSVNGQHGAVELTHDDVGARSATVPIPESDILGLAGTLSGKADVTVTNQLSQRISTQAGNLSNLTGRVDNMEGAWSAAVKQAGDYADAAADSASDAATSVQNIQDVEQDVRGIKDDVERTQTAINTTAGVVSDDATQARIDADYVATMVAVQVTALGLLNERFGDMDKLVTSVNHVGPDDEGNVSIFGGGTTLSLTEDDNNIGLFHVSATEQE